MPTVPPGGGQSWPEPRRRSSRHRWIIFGVSFAAVVALVVGLLFWQWGSNGDGESSTSADDGVDRTVGLLTEKDPVCDDWIRYADELAAAQVRWAELNREKPVGKWTADEREIYTSVGEAMTEAADHFEQLLPRARAVVLRELIAQTVVYLRSYVDQLGSYVAADDFIAGAANNFGSAVTYMCSAVPRSSEVVVTLGMEERSAHGRTELTPLMAQRDSACDPFQELIEEQRAALRGWSSGDFTKSSDRWTAEERRLNSSVQTFLDQQADEHEKIASTAESGVMRDFLVLREHYVRAFARSLLNYQPEDLPLWIVATSIGGGLLAACEAAQ